jgi:hypothetical protein
LRIAIQPLFVAFLLAASGPVYADDAQPVPPAPRVNTLERPSRILVLGDSNTHNGHLTGAMAQRLEQSHGYFGSGYRSVVADVGNGKDDAYQPYLRIANHGQWKSVHFIGGVAASVLSPDGTCLQSDSADDLVEVYFYGSVIDIYYAVHKSGGPFAAQVNGGPARQIQTASDESAIRRERLDGLTPGWHTLSIRPAGEQPVTITGVETHVGLPDARAAVVHKWGRSYAATSHYAGLQPEVWNTALPLLQPDWIVVMLGTNDHMNFVVPVPTMLNHLATICERLRQGAPEARLMIVSTVPVSDGESLSARLRHRYLAALPSLAEAIGADYWDLAEACGGSNEQWVARGETDDRIHFNLHGAQVIAPLLLEAIDRAATAPAPTPERFELRGDTVVNNRPDDLGSLTMWFTAEGPVALDAQGRVARWDNTVQQLYLPISRRVLHARALVPSMRPLWVENAIHGKPAVRFHGSSTALALPIDGAAQGFAMVMRMNQPGGALFGSSMALYKRYGPGPDGTRQLLDPDAADFKGAFYLNGKPLPRNAIEVPLNQYVVLSCEGGGAFAIIGANEHYQRYTPGPGDPETLSFFDGDIVELIAWSTLAPRHANQRVRLEAYLAEKYGIAIQQPTE